jgi:DNA-binding NarL/FixJ family response regulator
LDVTQTSYQLQEAPTATLGHRRTSRGDVIQLFPRYAVSPAPEKWEPEVTPEELTILTLMADGLTLDSVATRISVSQRTLSRRLRCVCDRLGVVHPIQAIVWAAHRGLI